MTVQIQAKFTKQDSQYDGLEPAREDMVKKPLEPRVIVAIVDVTAITHSVLDGSDTPKVRLRQVEVLAGAAAIAAVDLLNGRYSERTGRTDSQASLFDQFDVDVTDDGPSGDEIMAERAEAKAAALEAQVTAELDGAPQGDSWPGDIEFVAPPAVVAAGDAVAGTDGAEVPDAVEVGTGAKPRRSRK